MASKGGWGGIGGFSLAHDHDHDSPTSVQGQAGEGITSRLVGLSKQLGVRGLFLGLGARIVMVGKLANQQGGGVFSCIIIIIIIIIVRVCVCVCTCVGTLTAGQFAIYGDIKRVLGATGGIEIAKKKKE